MPKRRAALGLRRVLVAVLAAAALAAPAAAAAPATRAISETQITDSVSGFEIAATSTEGTFVGIATGDLPGGWKAVIDHELLSSTGPASIDAGGSFVLRTIRGRITGTFTGGTVTLENPSSTCADEHYAVDAELDIGSFEGVLTHHRVRILSRCVTYWASIAGTATLTVS